MNSRYYKMTGVRCLKGNSETVGIPHLPNYYDIRILPEYVFQTFIEGFSIQPDFPLIDITFLVLMEIFDRIL